jgi:hypothetical protein
MTAEIAIMNKMGVALAADSAVTISGNKGLKIYNTNKLFMLSRHEPVGVMLFSDAEMMRIPWESIIKSYRRELAATRFDTLEDYGRHFIAHLDKNTFLFPEAEQQRWLYQRMFEFLVGIRKRIDEEVKTVTQKKGAVTPDQLKRIVTRIIKEDHHALGARPLLSTLPPKFDQEVWKKHGAILEHSRYHQRQING